MPTSRRSLLAAASASLAAAAITPAAGRESSSEARGSLDDEVASLVRRSFESNAALMRGDIERYRSFITLTENFTLMSPFGGAPTRGSEMTAQRWEAMGRFFRNGTFEQQLIESYATRDMVVLATIERAHVEVGGLPPQDWLLRVTLVYCRDGNGWRLAHRHADPLVAGITLDQAALLARGEAR